MIGLDTNVLVRLITADDPVQTEQAALFLRDRCTSDNPGFVNCMTVVELLWVLREAYGYSRADIQSAMEALLANASLAFESREQIEAALLMHKATGCDLADALIGEVNRTRGCEATATFDRRAAKLKDFTLIS